VIIFDPNKPENPVAKNKPIKNVDNPAAIIAVFDVTTLLRIFIKLLLSLIYAPTSKNVPFPLIF
jgi:hypothetical protein